MTSFTEDKLNELMRRAKHAAWCEGRDAAAEEADRLQMLEYEFYNKHATSICALKSPYEAEK